MRNMEHVMTVKYLGESAITADCILMAKEVQSDFTENMLHQRCG